MTRKTSFLLPFLIFAVASGSAYSAGNYATEDYVDEQYIGIVDYVDSKNRTLKNTMTANDNQLYANQELLRDMLNAKDSSGAWLTLDTEAKLAIPAINELKAALDSKANADDVLTADSLTELNQAVAALESGKATVADLEALQGTVDALGDTYATDAELSAAIENVQSAIDNIDLSAYVKSSELAAVATSGQYADLQGKPEIPSIDGLATDQDLTDLRSALETEIANKQIAGDYLVAADLKTLEDAVAKLQSGKADASTVETIQTTINNLGDTYATDAELTAAIDAVKLLIPTIPTKVSVFENDAGYITDAALTDYAKSADVEMVANKVSDATAEQIEAMSSTDKATKYPSIAVSQTIANAAVTKVNEVAGDLSSLQTQVSTNTADIVELDKTVEKVSVVANAAIPAPTEACKSASGACALSSDTEGNLTWVVIAGSLNNN